MSRTTRLAAACACAATAFAGQALARGPHHSGQAPARGEHHAVRHREVAKTSAQDRTFLKTALEGDLFEIDGGRLALQKSSDPAVRALAQMLIADHSKSYGDGVKLAKRLRLDVPREPSPAEQWELQMISTLSGTSFDHWYSSLEVYDHRQDIEETTDEAREGTNPDVRSDARDELPMLRKHLALSEAALRVNS